MAGSILEVAIRLVLQWAVIVWVVWTVGGSVVAAAVNAPTQIVVVGAPLVAANIAVTFTTVAFNAIANPLSSACERTGLRLGVAAFLAAEAVCLYLFWFVPYFQPAE